MAQKLKSTALLFVRSTHNIVTRKRLMKEVVMKTIQNRVELIAFVQQLKVLTTIGNVTKTDSRCERRMGKRGLIHNIYSTFTGLYRQRL